MEDGKFIVLLLKRKSKITLIEKKIITEDQALVEVFKKFFINIVPNLTISTDHGYASNIIVTDNQVTNAVNKFRNHPSIIMIKKAKK